MSKKMTQEELHEMFRKSALNIVEYSMNESNEIELMIESYNKVIGLVGLITTALGITLGKIKSITGKEEYKSSIDLVKYLLEIYLGDNKCHSKKS